MTCYKYTGGIGLYAEVCIDTTLTGKNEDKNVLDACSWNLLRAAYNNAVVSEGHLRWKAAALQGIRFALANMENGEPFRITLLDVMGHVLHSNLYAMFAAGFTAVFKALGVALQKEDLDKLQQFVYASKDLNDRYAWPDEDKLYIAHYKV